MNKRNKYNKNKFINNISLSISRFKFKSINISFSKQMVIIWTIIWIFSLFLPWIKDIEIWTTWNSFYSLTWNIWFLLIIILSLTIFVTLSTNYKEKIKLYSDFSLKNHYIIIISWIFIISFSILTLNFINWLHTFFENIIYDRWVILSLTSWIIIFISWIFVRKEYYSNSSEIILDKLNEDRQIIKKEGNMKLPF